MTEQISDPNHLEEIVNQLSNMPQQVLVGNNNYPALVLPNVRLQSSAVYDPDKKGNRIYVLSSLAGECRVIRYTQTRYGFSVINADHTLDTVDASINSWRTEESKIIGESLDNSQLQFGVWFYLFE